MRSSTVRSCLDRRGLSNFNLLFRRDGPYFYAFDLLAVDGEDLREWPLIERKRRVRRLIPSVQTSLLYVAPRHRSREGVFRGWRVPTIWTLSLAWWS
jgi:bifunctional non-homologous end joining protein LigD